MTVLQAIIVGIVEGITEFLPISSTAHMILTSHALQLRETEFLKSFEIIIQLGAILSIVVLYWKRLWNLELIKKLFVAFLPTGIIGFTVYRLVKQYLLGNVPVVLAALVLGGIALIFWERIHGHDDRESDMSEITYRRALLIGVAQAVAMIPGVSRSAATIVGGSLMGVSKRTIVDFSFLLAIPTMAAATGYDLLKSYGSLNGHLDILAIGFVVSFITAIIAVKTFLGYIKRHSFAAFGWYRIILAAAFWLVFLR
jgi:undecaprenyl-diphosphatase